MNFLRSLSSLAAFRPRSPSCQICFQFCSTFFTTVRISSVFTILSSLKSCNGCIWWLRMASPSHDHMVVEYVVVSCQIFFSLGVWSYYGCLYKRGIFCIGNSPQCRGLAWEALWGCLVGHSPRTESSWQKGKFNTYFIFTRKTIHKAWQIIFTFILINK